MNAPQHSHIYKTKRNLNWLLSKVVKYSFHSIIQHPNYQQMKQYYHVSPLILDAGNFVNACDRQNVFKNSKYDEGDQREKLPVNIAFTQYYDTDNNNKVEYEYNDSMIRNGGEIDGYIVSEFGKTTLLPWLRNNVVYFTSCMI